MGLTHWLIASCALATAIAARSGGKIAVSAEEPSTTAPYQLMVDQRLPPVIGVESRNPQFSWAVPLLFHSYSAFEVRLFDASTLVWDSGVTPTTNLTMVYNGATALLSAHVYSWQVRVSGDAGTSDWSTNATFVTGLWNTWSGAPIWHKNASASFAFLRTDAPLTSTSGVASAYAFITANPYINFVGEAENAKLLAAYRLYVNGQWIGLGPGRPGTCGPMCPIQGDPMPCTCTKEHIYDSYDITENVAGSASIAIAIQAYNVRAGNISSGLDSKVLAEVRLTFLDGTTQAIATSPSWRAFAADPYMNASCCTETAWYIQPKENYIAELEPVGWRQPGFNDSSWVPAALASPFDSSISIVARPTLPIAILPEQQPAKFIRVSDSHYFADLGKEIQGGLKILFPNGTAGQQLEVRMGEELYGAGAGCAVPAVPLVRYNMRTGNSFQNTWTLRTGQQTIEHHEYLEFRYIDITTPGFVSDNPQCVNSDLGDYTSTLTLACTDPQEIITSVNFASYGTASGCCSAAPGSNTFVVNASCHNPNSASILGQYCKGKSSCSFTLQQLYNSPDPCHDVMKYFDAAVQCAPVAVNGPRAVSSPLPDLNITAWQLIYPATYLENQLVVDDPDLTAIWELCWYTVYAGGGLDMYVDSNTRQRSVICAEALNINILMQYATSLELAMQSYVLDYMLNTRPSGLGWAEWQALAMISTHHIWLHTGDLTIFNDHYEQLKNFTEISLVNATTGLWTCVGDDFYCNHPEIDWPPNMRDGFVFVPADTVVNSYTYLAMQWFSDMAEAAGGHNADVVYFRQAATAIRAAINSQLYDPATGSYYDGLTTQHAAWQTSVYALAFGLPTPDMIPAVFNYIVNQTVGTPALCQPGNVYPAQWALEGMYLTDVDHGFMAYEYLTCDGLNSWKAMLRQGATMTMEAWNPEEKPNLTWSHSWAASPADILPRYFFGIRPLVPGFQSLIIQPQPGPVTSGSVSVPTVRGPVAVSFNQTVASGKASYFSTAVIIPGATDAMVCLPASACAGSLIYVDGAASTGFPRSDYVCANVTAGPHSIQSSV